MNEIPGALLDALIDTAKLLPILFLTYLAMEAIEHYAGERTYAWIKKARGAGPLFGGLMGIIPQCGFAGGAASLYAAGAVTAGTLAAVFVATSDEMLPILISEEMCIRDSGNIPGRRLASIDLPVPGGPISLSLIHIYTDGHGDGAEHLLRARAGVVLLRKHSRNVGHRARSRQDPHSARA